MDVSHGQRIARNTFIVTAALIGQKILSFFYFTLIARQMSVEDTGRYFFAVSLTMIFSVFIDLGFSHVLVREVAKTPDRAASYLSTTLTLKIFLSIATYSALTLFLFLSRYSWVIILPTLLAGIAMILDSWHLALYAIVRARQRLQYEALGIIVGYALTFCVGVTILLLTRSLPLLMIALIVGSTFNLIWAAAVLKRHFAIPFAFAWNRELLSRLWRMALPFALAGIFVKVYSFVDTVFLSFLTEPRDLGLYSVPFKITYAFQFLPMGFAAAIFPAMSSFTVSSQEFLQKTFTRATAYLLFLALPITFGIWFLADEIILTIYGASYAGSILPLRILIFSLIFIFLSFPVGSFLNATNQQTLYTTIMGFSMVLNIGANFFLISRYGIYGAAVASLISQGFLFCVGIVAVARSLRLEYDALLHGTVRAVVSVTLMISALVVLRPYIHFLILILVGAFVYGASLLLVRAFTRQELQSALHSVKSLFS